MIIGQNLHNERFEQAKSAAFGTLSYNDFFNDQSQIKFFGNDNLNYNYPFSYQNFDANRYFIKNPLSSFMIRVKGDSMTGIGIKNSDVLLVDKSIKAQDGAVIVAEVNGKLVVKRYKITGEEIRLMSENKKYAPIVIDKKDNFSVWGVVISVIKQFN